MNAFALRATLLAVIALLMLGAALPVAAAADPALPAAPADSVRPQEHDGHGEEATTGAVQDSDRDVNTAVYWSLLGVGAGAVIFAGLYLLKKQLGGFPKNPTWVAPIQVMPSSTFPTEFEGGAEDHQGHGAHH